MAHGDKNGIIDDKSFTMVFSIENRGVILNDIDVKMLKEWFTDRKTGKVRTDRLL